MKTLISIFTIILCALSVQAQVDVQLKLNHKLGDDAFAFNQEATNDLSKAFTTERLEYYLSGFSIVHDGGKETMASDVYLLVKPEKNDTYDLGSFDITNIEAINFSVGVDKSQNNEDPTKWAASHALAPKSPSMHWGWAAGYRFLAIEGKSDGQIFQFHALGNDNYFPISIPTTAQKEGNLLTVELNADYSMILSGIDVSKGPIEHGESGEAKKTLNNFNLKVFSSLSGEGNTLNVDPILETKYKVYPNPSKGQFNVEMGTAFNQEFKLELTDITGRLLWTKSSNNLREISFDIENDGIFFLTITDSRGLQSVTRLYRSE